MIHLIIVVGLHFRRVAFCSKGEIFGHWDCDWQYGWTDLREAPTLTAKGIQILLKVRNTPIAHIAAMFTVYVLLEM